jgi:L-threonylcarbamoyladenylate synthase
VTAKQGEGSSPRVDAAEVRRFAECIAAGGVALFPADTVYGLACDPLNAAAVRRLYEIKDRPPARPAAVMFFALAPALEALPELAPRTRAALEALLPGPLTVLLPNPAGRFPLACHPAAALAADDTAGSAAGGKPGGVEATGATATLGLRVPLLSESLAALAAAGRPVLQSSANISGEPEARRLCDIAHTVRERVDLALDGGELPGIASTVLDLSDYERTGRWQVVRAGPVGGVELERALARGSAAC